MNELKIMKDFHEKLIPKFYINIETKELIYKIKLYRQISIINGDSGTGKSTIIKILDDYKKDSNNIKNIYVECNCNYITNPNISDLKILNLGKIDVIILDENNEILSNDNYINEILNNSIFMIIICRKSFKRLNYSMHEIYNIESEIMNGKIYNKLVRKYNDYNKVKEYTNVVTEDSKLGKYIVEKIFYNSNIKSSNSNSRLNKILKNINEDSCFIIDSSNFGPYIYLYYEIMKNVNYEVDSLFIESIEWLLLISINEFKYIYENLDKIIISIDNPKNLNLEKLYYKLLKDCLKEIGISFSKSDISCSNILNKNINLIRKEILIGNNNLEWE